MAIDKSSLETENQADIDTLNWGSCTQSIFEAAYSANSLCTDRKATIACSANLPDLNTKTVPRGTIVYPEDIGVPIMAGSQAWKGIDGRTFRKDVPCTTYWGTGYNGQRNIGVTYNLCGTGQSATCFYPTRSQDCFITTLNQSSITKGAYHAGFLDTSGQLWMFGYGYQGRLGDGCTAGTACEYARQTSCGGTDWCCVTAGVNGTIGLKTDGTLWAWGWLYQGEGGGGCPAGLCFSVPTCMSHNWTDWASICWAPTGCNVTSIRSNGEMWNWGDNQYGMLGVGTASGPYLTPVQESCSATNWCMSTLDKGNLLAVKTDGTAWGAGWNFCGSLGVNNTVSKCSLVQEASGSTSWCQVTSACRSSTFLKTDGTIWATGENNALPINIGAGSTSSPVQEITSGTSWSYINSDQGAHWGLKTDGTLWAWGYNGDNMLGGGTAGIYYSSPIQEANSFTDWVNVKHGKSGAIAVRKTL